MHAEVLRYLMAPDLVKKSNNGADMSLSVYVGNRKRDILILGKVSF